MESKDRLKGRINGDALGSKALEDTRSRRRDKPRNDRQLKWVTPDRRERKPHFLSEMGLMAINLLLAFL
jgi:hypothetical protein